MFLVLDSLPSSDLWIYSAESSWSVFVRWKPSSAAGLVFSQSRKSWVYDRKCSDGVCAVMLELTGLNLNLCGLGSFVFGFHTRADWSTRNLFPLGLHFQYKFHLNSGLKQIITCKHLKPQQNVVRWVWSTFWSAVWKWSNPIRPNQTEPSCWERAFKAKWQRLFYESNDRGCYYLYVRMHIWHIRWGFNMWVRRSSQMVPEMWTDLLSLDVKGTKWWQAFIQRDKLLWGILSGFISKGRHLCSCEQLLFVLLSSKNAWHQYQCALRVQIASESFVGFSFKWWVWFLEMSPCH